MNDLDVIHRFVVECERTKISYDLFQALFNKSDWQQQLFHSTAPKMFSDLNGIMVEYFYLQVSKLTDPARTQRKYDNLTTNYIVERIPWPDHVKDKLIALNGRLMAFSEHFTEYRNKLGAHLDLLENTDRRRTLGSFPEGEDTIFFHDLEEFLQIAIEHFSPDEHVSLDIAMSDDVDGLVRAIERSVAFAQCTRCTSGERARRVLDNRRRPLS
jgi:hypothetical protein